MLYWKKSAEDIWGTSRTISVPLAFSTALEASSALEAVFLRRESFWPIMRFTCGEGEGLAFWGWRGKGRGKLTAPNLRVFLAVPIVVVEVGEMRCRCLCVELKCEVVVVESLDLGFG